MQCRRETDRYREKRREEGMKGKREKERKRKSETS